MVIGSRIVSRSCALQYLGVVDLARLAVLCDGLRRPRRGGAPGHALLCRCVVIAGTPADDRPRDARCRGNTELQSGKEKMDHEAGCCSSWSTDTLRALGMRAIAEKQLMHACGVQPCMTCRCAATAGGPWRQEASISGRKRLLRQVKFEHCDRTRQDKPHVMPTVQERTCSRARSQMLDNPLNIAFVMPEKHYRPCSYAANAAWRARTETHRSVTGEQPGQPRRACRSVRTC